jgi:dihydrofolate reductase
MQRKMILAMDLDGCIGKDDGLPWRLRADMLRFKRLTVGEGNNAVLMGRTTWESLPEAYRPLNNRLNIVVTRNQEYTVEGIKIASSIEKGLDLAEEKESEVCWIIGGANVYEQCRELVDEVHVTMVETNDSGEIRVGLFTEDYWEKEVVETVPSDDKNEHETTYMILRRKS